jgi:hypothetical protein
VLCIDLFCGLGGWAEGFLSEGWDVIGFDIERHDYGTGGYPGQLVLQDATTLHGSQFRNADVIVASPPCQAYSYRAMPWKRAKALPPPDNTLFEACFRIQAEACTALSQTGGASEWQRERMLQGFMPIPLVVENVRGAEKWVGEAAWHFGPYYLWGDVPALMPRSRNDAKVPNQDWNKYRKEGTISPHWRLQHTTGPQWFDHGIACLPSNSARRKAASAQIAKIPFPLAQHIARVFKPG